MYQDFCTDFRNIGAKVEKTLTEILNERNVDSINVKTYMDENLVDYYIFPRTDNNGYAVNTKIDTIVKNKNGEWLVNLLDESDDEWDTLELTSWNFDASQLIDILGIIIGIFAVADDEYNGKVFKVGESIDEE